MTIQFHSVQLGPDPTDAPVLLFLHGFMGSVEDWWPVMQSLGADYCCLAIDLPGHGQTCCEKDEDYVMENTAGAIADFLSAMQISTAIPVGYSMGGRIALYCSLSFPQRFPQAIIESGSPGLRDPKDQKTRRDQDLERSRQIKKDFLNFVEGWYRQPLFTSLREFSTGFEEMKKRRLKNCPAGLSLSLEKVGLGRQPNLWKNLDSHRNPLLLLTGELDQKFTQINREMTARCGSAEHGVMPGAGHNLHLEQPEAFVRCLRAWLASGLAGAESPNYAIQR